MNSPGEVIYIRQHIQELPSKTSGNWSLTKMDRYKHI